MAKLVSDWANIRIILLSASIYLYFFAIGKQNDDCTTPKRRFIFLNRRLKKFFCRFNFFFRRFDKHLILYALVKVWKALFETVKIQYKKRGYRRDTLFFISVLTDCYLIPNLALISADKAFLLI